MAKDSYWFRHDSTAGRGLRMRKMAHIHGHWGKGIYWDVIEILRDQSAYAFDCEPGSLQMLCDLIGCKDEAKFLSWYRDCIKLNLLTEEDGLFFSDILCENMQKWEQLKDNGSKGGRPKKPKRNQTANQNETIIGYNIDNRIDIIEHKSAVLSQQLWCEDVCMKFRLTKDQLPIAIDTFIQSCNIAGDTQKTEKDFKNHFRNWAVKMGKDLIPKQEFRPAKIGPDGQYIR